MLQPFNQKANSKWRKEHNKNNNNNNNKHVRAGINIIK